MPGGPYYDLTAANAALKELYAGQEVKNLVYKTNPFMALVPKDTEFEGEYKPIPVIIGASQGRSSTFANAQSNQSPVQAYKFLLARRSDYSIATLDNQTMMASRSDKGSFIRATKTVVDGAFRSITLSLASSLYRSGTGSIGQIGSITGGVITLNDPNAVVQFELNMVLQANATDGGTSPRAALGYVVGPIDRVAGTVGVSTTFGGALASPSGWTTSDYILVQGDLNAKPQGLLSWLPPANPGASDNFFGVNRSVDPTRLGGVRYANGANQPVEEALVDASNLVAREGGVPDYAFASFASYSALEKALGAKVQYAELEAQIAEDVNIGFRGIRIHGANGPIDVIPDRNCPGFTAFLLQLDTWCLESLGEAPMLLRYLDSNEFLRVYNQDAAECRVGFYGNIRTDAPGWSAYVALQN
jgi:hypothetical protein